MTALGVAAGLALFAALAHSYLSERIFLAPLRAEQVAGSVFSGAAPKRLVVAMFHLPSLCWASMAISLLVLEPAGSGYRETLLLFAAVYALSGIGNFWALGKVHPGGVVLLCAAAAILGALVL